MAKKRINREKDFDKGTVKFTVQETGEELTCSVGEVPKEIVQHLLVHAINAKIGDAAADPKQNAMEAMTGVWDQLKSGEWNARSGGGGATRTTVLAEAVSKVTGRDLEEVKIMLAEKSDDEKKELRQHAQVKAAMSAIQAERAKVKAKAEAKEAADAAPLEL